MSYLSFFIGAVLIAVALFYWHKWYKRVTDDDTAWFSKPGKRENAESLEEFVAAYRRGEIPVNDPAPAPVLRPAATAGAPAPMAPAVTVGALPVAVPVVRESFLSGAPKLGYLLCKSALRDHHVFAQVPLRTLASPGLDPKVAELIIDVLVCNAQLAPVAAIDVAGIDAPPPDATKVQALRSLGIRYLRLSAKSLPKPEQLKDLLYRM